MNLLAPFNWDWFPHGAGQSRSVDIGYILCAVLALVGCRELVRRRASAPAILTLLPLATLAGALLFYGSPRFRLPAEITLLILAAVGIVKAVGSVRPGWARRLDNLSRGVTASREVQR